MGFPTEEFMDNLIELVRDAEGEIYVTIDMKIPTYRFFGITTYCAGTTAIEVSHAFSDSANVYKLIDSWGASVEQGFNKVYRKVRARIYIEAIFDGSAIDFGVMLGNN
jgi:hypothetical protein